MLKKHTLLPSLSIIALLTSIPNIAGAETGSKESKVTFKPTISVSESYDDNIYTERTDAHDDFYTKITPEFYIESGSDEFKTRFNAGITKFIYSDDPDNNRLDFTTGLKANAKINSDLAWEGLLDYRRGHSERGDADADPTNDILKPPVFTAKKASTALSYKILDFTLKPRVGITNYNFDDGVRMNGTVRPQNFRDRNEYIFGGRAIYNLAKDFDVFGDVEYNPRNYTFSSAAERTSVGGTYQGGVSFKPRKDMKIDLAAGYIDRKYDQAIYRDIHAPYFAGSWKWDVTEETVLGASVDRVIMEITDAGSSGSVRTISKITLAQKLGEKLTAKLEGRFTKSAYEGGNGATNGTDRDDNLYDTLAGFSYELTPQIKLNTDYIFTNKDSDRETSDSKRHVVTIGMTYGF